MSKLKRLADEMARIHANEFQVFWEAVDESASILQQIDPIKRKLWLVEVIQELLESQDGNCAICLRPVEFGNHHVDHKVPFTLSGGNERSNLQIAHPLCNQRRGVSIGPDELMAYLEDRVLNC